MQIPRNNFFIPPDINLNDKPDQPKLPLNPDHGPCAPEKGGIAGRFQYPQLPDQPLPTRPLPK